MGFRGLEDIYVLVLVSSFLLVWVSVIVRGYFGLLI